jgi:MFS family permease
MFSFDPRPDSPYAWFRLGVALCLMTIGGSSMYAIVVILPQVQADFGISRSAASFPYTMTMIGFGLGGVVMGRLADRFGIRLPLLFGSVLLGIGFILASYAGSLWPFVLIQGILIGLLGSSATFGPLMADSSFWFEKRRGVAVAICASGNYLAGAVWPPIVEWGMRHYGWRGTYFGIGVFVLLTMVPLSALMRRRPAESNVTSQPTSNSVSPQASSVANMTPGTGLDDRRVLGLPPNLVMAMLCVAGVACCVAMSMPQVHIVAYCGDLGFGAARGAQMLSLMLACGVISRLISGVVSDRIGGLRTLLLGSLLQGIALLLFLPFDGLVSLYVISALFGLFQGGIVPAYAIIVRELFPAQGAATRVSMALMSTLLGMALGGWLSGKIFDLTGTYTAAFINGIGWNLLNLSIIGLLLIRQRRQQRSTAT